MRGFTRKRGKTWTALWDHYDPQTGKRKQKSQGGFHTQKEAQQHLATVVVSVAEGTFVEPTKQPLGRFLLDESLPAASGTLRPLSIARYGKVIDNYIVGRPIADIPLRGLSGGHLNALYAELAHLSVATRRLVHAVLRRALNDAVRWRKIVRSPAAGADPPKQTRTRVEAWTETELRRFLAHVADDRLFALYRLGATTGARRGELLGVQWRDLDYYAARLRIERQALPTRGGVTFGPTKSDARTIKLDPETVAALRHHRELQLLERDLAGTAYEDGDLIFCDELGRVINPEVLTQWFNKLPRRRASRPGRYTSCATRPPRWRSPKASTSRRSRGVSAATR